MTLIICKERQKILDEVGHILVTGGPGSGKTTIAIKKATERIEYGLLPGQSVLFLSFSRAAVARIIESAEGYDWAPKDILKRLTIQTFHSFFWRLLKTHGYLLGCPRRINILLPHDEKARNGGIDEGSPDWLNWTTERTRLFSEEGLVVFDLFSPLILDLLGRSEKIKNLVAHKFPLIILDEAQDTDEYQWECVRQLADKTQLLCLADLEQQIYDFRPGVSSERVTHILEKLRPLRVDLGTQNNRSSSTEILKFGNDVLLNTPRSSIYEGVSRIPFSPKASMRDRTIRQSVGRIYKNINDETGQNPKNLCFLASWGKGVTVISNALRGRDGDREIPHQVLFDETSALLSSRAVAFILEPKHESNELPDLSIILSSLAEIESAKGTVTGAKKFHSLQKAATIASDGQIPRSTKLIKGLLKTFQSVRAGSLTGDPKKDWLQIRRILRNSEVSELKAVDNAVQYLMAFNRGKKISEGLSQTWRENGEYRNARSILEKALSEIQLFSDDTDIRGIHVMTLHKAKGKEFDGVIIFDESRISPLLYGNKKHPYTRCRKLLRVGITRARSHVFLLTDRFNPTPLLRGFHL